MVELEDACRRILATMPPPKRERVALAEALGRVLVQPVSAPLDLPMFDNSAVDGYAVRAADVAGARLESPVRLCNIGRSAAGEVFPGTLGPGECLRLFTGSPLPHGADAVVMQEDSRTDPADPAAIQILDAVKPLESVRLQGEDVKRGTPVLAAGEILTPARISLLAALGSAWVEAGRQPVVGILATGSELREPGQALAAGQIYEGTRLALAALARRASAQSKTYPLVPDTLTGTQRALEQALSECDVVVSTGGVSVGELDFVKAAFERLGGELQFWKVAVKPGRPFVFGRCREKYLFGLPGNPVSALVTFLLLVRPALLHWQGAKETALPSQSGLLVEPLANPDSRRHFVRVRVDQTGQVVSAGIQASHVLSSLAAANGLVDVPPRTTLEPGSRVTVCLWD